MTIKTRLENAFRSIVPGNFFLINQIYIDYIEYIF